MRLHRELGTTMIYVTHDQVEAMTMGDRIAVFNEGRIEQLGAPLDLYQLPANEFVAGFLGAPRINLIARPGEGATAAHRALWQQWLPAPAAGAQRAGLRAEHLRVGPADLGIPAQVEVAEHLGDSSILHLRVAGLLGLLHAKLGADAAGLSTGRAVGLHADTSRALAFDAAGHRID